MTKDELLEKLTWLAMSDDIEDAHGKVDDALLDYINDPDITKAFNDVPRWYS